MKVLIKLELDTVVATLGVNSLSKKLSLSNYSLTKQIIIINLSTTCLSLFVLLFINFFLLNNDKNLNNQNKIITEKIDQITDYLSKNAIKRILTFDDSCSEISTAINREQARIECNESNLLDNNYKDKLPQLEPTYTQKYIYSNYLNTDLNIKVIADNWIKFADTDEIYNNDEEVIISDIDIKIDEKNMEKLGFYQTYEKWYFFNFNFFKKFFDQKRLNKQDIEKIKNDNILVMETIKSKVLDSYIYKNKDNDFKAMFSSPIVKDNKVYGVVLIDSLIFFDDLQGASKSILLTNFFIFLISIMFLLSLLFSKSIVTPIKILSRNTNLEKEKKLNKKNIINYLDRKDEIGTLSDDIRSMSNDLKKRIKEIEEFASDVSHELKNPLASLKSSSDLLSTKLLAEKDKRLLIKNMSNDIDRMNILISDISSYTLTSVEIHEEAFEDVELISFFNDFKNSLSNSNFLINISVIEKEIFVKINKGKFIQVMHNLLDNALSYLSKLSKILIFIKIDAKTCVINFVDQGPGIPIDYKDKIFERFYTDRDVNNKSHSGLGLSISKKIIESFDGNINLIKSTHIGFEGACFEIKLPLKE